MLALEAPLPRDRPGFLHRTPLVALAALAAAWAASVAALPDAGARVVGLAAAHGALLGTALAWTSGRGQRDRCAPLEAALLLGGAATAALLLPWGALAYAVLPAWLAWRRPAWLTSFASPAGPAVAGGVLFGLLLGAHLLVTGSLTLGYRVRAAAWPELVGWWAYDVGANVLAAEAFFRGALFERAHRRWSFAAAAALSTTASVARYLVDPLLPRSLEIAAGAAFYLVLLGAGNCWLLARTGSLVPPLAAASVFFCAYRLLAR
ncbi:MAG TPA: CPBP family glutamic-type intramembrane protease [Methylomirabilota bacterium]|nr:CPBP family glutamic-type intramembrane protease [Methylomirabilota bacterium]